MSRTPDRARSVNWWWANGSPATGINAFGTSGATFAIRVPRPRRGSRTARLAPGNDLRAVVIEREPHFLQTLAHHRFAEREPIARVEEQESTTAGSDEFAAGCATCHAGGVPSIDPLVG